MSEEATPGALGSNAGLGVVPWGMRPCGWKVSGKFVYWNSDPAMAIERARKLGVKPPTPLYSQHALDMAVALAVSAERERCAQLFASVQGFIAARDAEARIRGA